MMKKPAILLFILLLTSQFILAQQLDTVKDSLVLSLQQADSLSEFLPIVYSNKGCGRCVTAENFLQSNGIDFIHLSLALEENRIIMYQVATGQAAKTNISILYPVIIYKKEVYYGQTPLQEYLESLREKIRLQETSHTN
ncbi:MAG TPA: hypothetical protein PKX96_09210 [Dysgonamonadaceae bacterium]|jgi:glutaredoxin|nr:hypothetical protein [Bacteroidota bacterium]OQC35867.1 MAG: hypothetical protein BWX63_02216 [Bacteroidetes bacterium ADurb.Bin041]HOU64251.1 hypothetical protein [Tenuifilaceae bacterium]HQG08915.1 hypothetical protein [Dysgonamonadaceae bacterium]HQI64024.1 hypothetical protein [Bacteroidales bacterium]